MDRVATNPAKLARRAAKPPVSRKEMWKLNNEEKFAVAEEARATGNAAFRDGDYEVAEASYEKVCGGAECL